MTDDLENIIYSEAAISRRVKELGALISSDYRDRDLLLIGILKGSFIFLADLVRCMDIPCEIRFLGASSYGYAATSSGMVTMTGAPDFEVRGRNLIVVEDILDTGITLRSIVEYLAGLHPESVRVCALLDKTARREAEINAHYVGFDCPDAFCVGYGLDYAEKYRNLPYIAALKREIYS